MSDSQYVSISKDLLTKLAKDVKETGDIVDGKILIKVKRHDQKAGSEGNQALELEVEKIDLKCARPEVTGPDHEENILGYKRKPTPDHGIRVSAKDLENP
jgi:hypothetical protein